MRRTHRSDVSRRKRISINTKKELRARQLNYLSKVESKEEVHAPVNDLVERHNKLHSNIDQHIKRELNTQEDEFKKKMEQRRDRSLNRSLSKSKAKDKKDEDVEDTTNLLKHLKLESKGKVDNPFEM